MFHVLLKWNKKKIEQNMSRGLSIYLYLTVLFSGHSRQSQYTQHTNKKKKVLLIKPEDSTTLTPFDQIKKWNFWVVSAPAESMLATPLHGDTHTHTHTHTHFMTSHSSNTNLVIQNLQTQKPKTPKLRVTWCTWSRCWARWCLVIFVAEEKMWWIVFIHCKEKKHERKLWGKWCLGI